MKFTSSSHIAPPRRAYGSLALVHRLPPPIETKTGAHMVGGTGISGRTPRDRAAGEQEANERTRHFQMRRQTPPFPINGGIRRGEEGDGKYTVPAIFSSTGREPLQQSTRRSERLPGIDSLVPRCFLSIMSNECTLTAIRVKSEYLRPISFGTHFLEMLLVLNRKYATPCHSVQ